MRWVQSGAIRIPVHQFPAVSPTAPKILFTDDFKAESYWWDTTGSGAAESQESRELPREVDVAIIGAGYTGLHTAIQTARGGRSTLLLDAEQVGWGCSSRNGGQVGTGLKPGLDALCRTYGASRGHEIFAEGARSLDWIGPVSYTHLTLPTTSP